MAKGALDGVPRGASVNEKRDANSSIFFSHFPASETVAALITREGLQDVWQNGWYLLTLIFFQRVEMRRAKPRSPHGPA